VLFFFHQPRQIQAAFDWIFVEFPFIAHKTNKGTFVTPPSRTAHIAALAAPLTVVASPNSLIKLPVAAYICGTVSFNLMSVRFGWERETCL
jgi:hypothetical protein